MLKQDRFAAIVDLILQEVLYGKASYDEVIHRIEKLALTRTLTLTGNNKAAAANLLKLNRTTFTMRLKSHGFSLNPYHRAKNARTL